MDLLVAIAIGLTVWRLVKYFKARDEFRSANSNDSSHFRPTQNAPTHRGTLPFTHKLARYDRRLRLRYRDAEGRVTDRTIEIYRCDPNYVFAWCHLRKEPRTFRVENILQWEVLNESFQRDPTIDRYIAEQLVPKNWSAVIPWEDWQQTRRPRGRTPVSVEPTRRESTKDESAYWISPGREISVNGYRITKGGIYVGSGLTAASGFSRVEPALIDPEVPVDRANADNAGRNMPYWPSYLEMTPATRAGYLGWLVNDCQNPEVHVGYPLLFLYGLERRLLGATDPFRHDESELSFFRQEGSSLLRQFGKIDSFQRYGGSFLDLVEACVFGTDPSKTSPPAERPSDVLPLTIQVAIARFIHSGLPIPAEWALSLVLCHPETRLRMPAKRCRRELQELFQLRYTSEFQDGIHLRPGKGLLKLQYRPASSSFGQEVTIPTSLPNVSALRTIPSKLLDLVARCTDELDAYSRYVGNKDAGESDLASIALLPVDLVRQHQGRVSLDFKDWLETSLGIRDLLLLSGNDLFARWKKNERLSKSDYVQLTQLLEKWDYGIEPDVRFGGPTLKAGEKVVLFRLGSGAASTPSREYALATLLLDLGVTVVMADGVLSDEEERRLEHQLESALGMDQSERRRLKAHLRWLTSEERSLSGLSKRLESLPNTEKARLAQCMISLAGSDGYIKIEEIEALSKIYSLLGFPESLLHADLHSLSLQGATTLEEDLVTVRPVEPANAEYRIPRDQLNESKNGVQLDMQKVNAKLIESATVSALLATIFVDHDEVSRSIPIKEFGIGSLSPIHSQFLISLTEKETWERAEIEELASKLSILPDGALETINEASFDAAGEPLWEGEDPIRINISIGKEMMSCQTSR